MGSACRIRPLRRRPDREDTGSPGATGDHECVPEISTTGQCAASNDLVSRRADSTATGEARNRSAGSNLGTADQRKDSSDAEESVLRRSVRLWQDGASNGDRGGARAPALSLQKAAKRMDGIVC